MNFGALVFIKFASGDASTSHQHDEMKSPGDGFMEILTLTLRAACPPFLSSTPFISGNSYGASLKLVYFPLRGPYSCQAPFGVYGNLLTLSVDWLPGTRLISAQSSSSPCPDSFAEPSHKPTRKPPGRAQTEAHTEQTHTWVLGYSSQSYFTFPVSLQLWV